ncbi:hypothetical protein NR798_25790 [Archangium gephyra]|uniref:hypothetical protein n=1 Tax=Archangium gephyra TaxID=48 RepID=UPI0035D4B1E5
MGKPLAAVSMMVVLFAGTNASATGSCVFYASDSIYYFTSSASSLVYARGPISFVWEPDTGRVLSGYYPEKVVYYVPVITAFNNVSSGSISGTTSPSLNLSLTMGLTRSYPNTYNCSLQSGTLTGTFSSATLRGYLDGPYLIVATGTVTCN